MKGGEGRWLENHGGGRGGGGGGVGGAAKAEPRRWVGGCDGGGSGGRGGGEGDWVGAAGWSGLDGKVLRLQGAAGGSTKSAREAKATSFFTMDRNQPF